MKQEFISPRVLKGFRDMYPKQQVIRERCITKLQHIFQLYGFVPIDTPVLEYQDVLLGHTKQVGTAEACDTEKQVYAFEDKGKRAVAMRFDLTVPFARYAAIHHLDLPRPFNRYQIGKVFRGENAQRGRYREFIQCDFDIIGLSNEFTESTIVMVIDSALTALHGIVTGKPANNRAYKIHISHRGILSALLKREKCDEHTVPILRIMDKIRKIPHEQVVENLCAYMSESAARNLIETCRREAVNTATLDKLRSILGDHESYRTLKAIDTILLSVEPQSEIIVDPSIVRGLDYYTGFVCETFIRDNPSIGSVCSGGRYDNLTQRFNKIQLSGVGASIGLDRLLASFEEVVESKEQVTIGSTLLYGQTQHCAHNAFAYLAAFHEAGIVAQVYPTTQGLKQAFKYAEKIAAQFLIIIGEEEQRSKTLTVKNLHTREQCTQKTLQETIQWIKQQAKTL